MIDIPALLGDAPAGRGAAPPATVVVPGAGGDMAMGAYEAADRFDASQALWAPAIQSADADIVPDKDIVDAKARDMLRNDSYVHGGARLRQDNIVGAQFLPNARPATARLRAAGGAYFDDKWEEEFQEEVEELFDLYAESPDNWIDASRSNNFTSLIRMGVGIELASGEMLATVEWDRERGGDFATTIQMVDLDRLSTAPLSRMDKNVVAGVRKDRRGAPTAYQIRTQHPSDIRWQFTLPEWKEIEARKPWGRLQVIHLVEQMRPDQTRGISEMVSALPAMRMGHKVRGLNLQRIATQSLYAAAITSEMPTEQVFAMLGGQTSTDAVTDGYVRFAEGFLGAIAQYAGNAKNLHIDGVKIPHLFPGTKLDLLSPNRDNISGSEFEQSLLRYIAASIGVSYEQLSRDYSKANYSSMRAAMTETWKFMQARKKLTADRFGSAIWRLWLEEGVRQNRFTTFPRAKAPLLYTNGRLNLMFDALTRVEWIGASRGQIDELKETQAAIARLESGLSTYEDELARLGKDWRKVYRQLKREAALRDQLGLTFVGMGARGRNEAVVASEAENQNNEERKAA